MRTPPSRPHPRYRNEAVFRSAQQLLAPRPPAPTPRAAPRVPRLIGALGLLILGVVIGRYWPRAATSEIDSPARVNADIAMIDDAAAPVATVDESPRDLTNRLKFPAPKSANSRPREAKPPLDDLTSASPLLAHPIDAARTSFGSVVLPAAPAISATVTTNGPAFTLRGMLSFDTPQAAPLAVEFSLRRKGKGIAGVVRYLSPEGDRLVANTVFGNVTGRVVDLREKDLVWIKAPITPPTTNPAWRELGRSFVFELPETAAAEIIGRWSLGDRGGKLTLSAAAPW